MKIISRFSGEKRNLPIMSSDERSLWLMKKTIKGFDNFAVKNSMFLSFLTITQSNRSLDDGYRWITGIMHAMQVNFVRRGLKIIYVAVLEIQPKRYKKYGVIAPHWHVAIACSMKNSLPHSVRDADTGRIKKIRDGDVITWAWLLKNVNQKFGMYFCCDCWSKQVYEYLSKYLAKGDLLQDFRDSVGRRIRVFSHSQIGIEYFMSYMQKSEYAHLIDENPDLKDLYQRRKGSRFEFCSREAVERVQYDGQSSVKMFYRVVTKIKGEWVKDLGESVEEIRLQKTSSMVSGSNIQVPAQ